MTRRGRIREGTEAGFTLVELLIVMSVFAVIGSGVAGAISIWYRAAEGSTGQAVLSAESQSLARHFAADVSSTTLTRQIVPCTDATDFPLQWQDGVSTYDVDYQVSGATLTRGFRSYPTGTPPPPFVQTTLVQNLKANTNPCTTLAGTVGMGITSKVIKDAAGADIGTTRTLTLVTAVTGTRDYIYSVIGSARGSPLTAFLGPIPQYIPIIPITLNGTFSSNILPSAPGNIRSVSYYSCRGVACTPSPPSVKSFTPATVSDPCMGAAPYSLVLDFNLKCFGNAGDGTYSVEARVIDSAGNTATSNVDTATLDTTAPIVTLAPLNSPTNISTLTFSGVVGIVSRTSTSSRDLAAVTLKIFQGPTPLPPLTVSAIGNNWTTTTPLLDGTYTAQAFQSDEVGNVGTSLVRAFVVDTTPPVVTVTAPAGGAFVKTTKPVITGTAGVTMTPSADSLTVTVRIYDGTNVNATPIQSPPPLRVTAGAWSMTAAALPANKQYTVKTTQTDAAGNTGSATATFVDDTALTLTAPASNRGIPTFVGTAGAAPATATSSADGPVTVKVYRGNGTIGTPVQTLTATPSAAGAWSAPPPLPPTAPLIVGQLYTVQASQTDGAGNTAISTAYQFTP